MDTLQTFELYRVLGALIASPRRGSAGFAEVLRGEQRLPLQLRCRESRPAARCRRCFSQRSARAAVLSISSTIYGTTRNRHRRHLGAGACR